MNDDQTPEIPDGEEPIPEPPLAASPIPVERGLRIMRGIALGLGGLLLAVTLFLGIAASLGTGNPPTIMISMVQIVGLVYMLMRASRARSAGALFAGALIVLIGMALTFGLCIASFDGLH